MDPELSKKFLNAAEIKQIIDGVQEIEKILSLPAFPLNIVTIGTKAPCADIKCFNLITSVELATFIKQMMVIRLNGMHQ